MRPMRTLKARWIVGAVIVAIAFCGPVHSGYAQTRRYPTVSRYVISSDLTEITVERDAVQPISVITPGEYEYLRLNLRHVLFGSRWDRYAFTLRYVQIPEQNVERFARITIQNDFNRSTRVFYLSKSADEIIVTGARDAAEVEVRYPYAYNQERGSLTLTGLPIFSRQAAAFLDEVNLDLLGKLGTFSLKMRSQFAAVGRDRLPDRCFATIDVQLSQDEEYIRGIAERYFAVAVAEGVADTSTGAMLYEMVRGHVTTVVK